MFGFAIQIVTSFGQDEMTNSNEVTIDEQA